MAAIISNQYAVKSKYAIHPVSEGETPPEENKEPVFATRSSVGMSVAVDAKDHSSAMNLPANYQKSIASFSAAAMIDVPDSPRLKSANLELQVANESNCLTPVLDPRTHRMQQWDGVILLLLVHTTYVTPFEVSFMVDKTQVDALYIVNRFIDLCFFIDIVKSFMTSYFDEDGQTWESSHWNIAKRYLRSWFVLDFVSILPFDSLSMMNEGVEGSAALEHSKSARLIRIMRLFKLLRLVRGARILQRWQVRPLCSFRANTITT
jgi:hypothetical protein